MDNSLESINVTVGSCNFDFFYRPNSIGDRGVIGQIFKQNDYDISHFPLYKRLSRYMQRFISEGRKPLIIDAGANIGASSLYFHAIYPDSLIIAIEPDVGNCDIFRVNCKNIDNIILLDGGVASNDGLMALEDPGLSDWGFRLVEPKDSSDKYVHVYSMSRLLSERIKECYLPIIVKIDIEGGESELFRENTKWLKDVPLLIIELHDWMLPGSASSNSFLQSISSFNFDFLYRGENVFCFNNDILMSNDLDDKAEDFLITIASRDAEIHELQQTVASRDAEIHELQQTVASRDAEIHELQQTVARFRSDLEKIYCSRSWRIVNLVRRFRNILFTGSDL